MTDNSNPISEVLLVSIYAVQMYLIQAASSFGKLISSEEKSGFFAANL